MADDLMTDEEQVERLRQWWSEYGWMVIAGVAVGLAVIVGRPVWRDYREGQLVEASKLYDQALAAAADEDAERVRSLAATLAEDYRRSPYDTEALLLLAKLQVQDGELEAALQTLSQAEASAGSELVTELVRQRRARVLLALDRPEAALEVLGDRPLGQFAMVHHELTGDALARLGREAEARTAYNDALLAMLPGTSGRLIELKIAALGAGSGTAQGGAGANAGADAAGAAADTGGDAAETPGGADDDSGDSGDGGTGGGDRGTGGEAEAGDAGT